MRIAKPPRLAQTAALGRLHFSHIISLMLNLQIAAVATEIANAWLSLALQRHRFFPRLPLLQRAGWANRHALAAALAAAIAQRQTKIRPHHSGKTAAVQAQRANTGHFLASPHAVTAQNTLAHIPHNKGMAGVLRSQINLARIFLRLRLIFLRIMQQTALEHIAAATLQAAAGLVHRFHLVVSLGHLGKIAPAIIGV